MCHRFVDGKSLETLWLPPEIAGNPAIVMLHEGLGSIALWKNFPKLIAKRTGCGVLIYSRYGHGRSDRLSEKRPLDYMHREGEVVLPSLLEQLGIARPILLGHSDGASIALIYASKYPGGLRGLILEAPHVFVEEKALRGIAQMTRVFESSDLPSKLDRYHDYASDTFRGWSELWLDSCFRSWNIEACLSSIQCPVLVIQGEDDEYGTALQMNAIQARIPTAEIVMLRNCGHSPHRDQSDVTIDRIAQFVASHSLL